MADVNVRRDALAAVRLLPQMQVDQVQPAQLADTGLFSRGEDRCKSGVLADRAGSDVVIHPPSPGEVVVHVAGPRWPGF
jgi:hypothetical protein